MMLCERGTGIYSVKITRLTCAHACEFFLIFAITAITKSVNDWLTESCNAEFSDSKVIAVIAKRALTRFFCLEIGHF